MPIPQHEKKVTLHATITTTTTMPDGPVAIHLTPHERETQRLSTRNLEKALAGLHQDGLLLLKNIVSPSHLSHLQDCMSSQTHSLLHSSPRAGLYNQGVTSNILHCPPLDDPSCYFSDIYFNPYITHLASAYLGHKPIWNFITGNNALANTAGKRQPVHKDITFANHPLAPFYFIANFPLSDFGPHNGATEFWLGSHAHTTSKDQIPCTAETRQRASQVIGLDPTCEVKPELVEERRRIRPPVQAICGKGDVLIRDLRTWHAGMPNASAEDRVMIAVGYQAPWYGNHTQKVYVPKGMGGWIFERAQERGVEARVELVSEEEKLWRNYEFTFEPSGRGKEKEKL